MPVSRAVVATASAERYAKQLSSHLGRKVRIEQETGGTRVVLDAGSCLLAPGPDALTLRAQAPSDDGLLAVQDVVGRHLERFGRRDELVVVWHEERE